MNQFSIVAHNVLDWFKDYSMDYIIIKSKEEFLVFQLSI